MSETAPEESTNDTPAVDGPRTSPDVIVISESAPSTPESNEDTTETETENVDD